MTSPSSPDGAPEAPAPVRLGLRDRLLGTGRLLAGHLERFRHPGLQDEAARLAGADGVSSPEFRLVNATIALRAAIEREVVLDLERRRSRRRWLTTSGLAPDRSVPTRAISLLCPSRQRSEMLARYAATVEGTAVHPDRIELLVYLDDDDPELARYRAWAGRLDDSSRLGRVELIEGPRIGLGPAWNQLAERASGDLLMMGNDDQLFVSYGWDRLVDQADRACEEKWPDLLYCLWFADGDDPTRSVDFPIVTRAWFDALGYFVPDIFRNWQNERWVFDLAFRVGRAEPIRGVQVEHCHYQDYRAPFDATYLRHRRTRQTSEADARLMRETAGQREAEAAKLERAMRQAQGRRSAISERAFDRVRLDLNRSISHFQAYGLEDAADALARSGVEQGLWSGPLQRPERYVPGLTARPLHEPDRFWFRQLLHDRFEALRAEAEPFLAPGSLPLVDERLSLRGSWTQLVLYESGRRFEEACALVPVLAEVMRSIPEASLVGPGVVTLSRLDPGTVIAPHCGRTNASLRVHLPLWADPGASMVVGDYQVTWREGEMVVFDDSFQHAVRHDGDRVRIVLLFDVWHPELGADERERMLAERSSTERQIIDYLRENDIAAVERADNGTILQAGPHLAALIDRHLDDPSITRIELRGEQLHYSTEAGTV